MNDRKLTATGAFGQCLLAIGIGTLGFTLSGQAMAGCGAGFNAAAASVKWDIGSTAALTSAVYQAGTAKISSVDFGSPFPSADIVGLWKFTFTSDGTSYPGPIPLGVQLDFGTTLWTSDGTEIMFSGARAPSTGDVCMGVWKRTGRYTYQLKHLAIGWASSDSPPPAGPVSPAVYAGTSIIRETVTLNRAGTAFEGTFTIDQYAPDDTTLLEHVSGKVAATRVTVD